MKAGGKPKFKYKRVKIIWQDIITDASWFDSLEDVEKLTFQWCEDIGYLFYEGIFDEVECKFELERQKKYIEKQASIIFALERELEEKNNEIIIIKGKLKEKK